MAEIQLVSEMRGGTGAGSLMATPAFQVDRGGGCTGQWELEFISPRHAPPLNAPTPGDYPPVVMMRTFTVIRGTEVQSCLLPNSRLAAYSNCFDYFVVKLEKT